MKLQNLALGLALALAGSAFAATTTRDITVTRDTPHGTVTRHIVKTQGNDRLHERHVRRVVVVHPQQRHHMKKVVVVHPAHHGRHEVNRTVVIHHRT
ncbi:hypothetical protein [Ramlibacter alkalitolerans]|jgi:hypothetical protein|uniref:Uncharacterized protein n=1 Tax=Ramlibacter alkalitolerans TaxID=2039631 RepID=A0ABS1JPJ3_9BURK|nr:hypothetical protein [Ramlibacter alkalitolerans]MBL0426179.1 hypothetical protein [Ramlibacter alkalitolerans]